MIAPLPPLVQLHLLSPTRLTCLNLLSSETASRWLSGAPTRRKLPQGPPSLVLGILRGRVKFTAMLVRLPGRMGAHTTFQSRRYLI